MSIVTRLSQVLPAVAHVHKRALAFTSRAHDALLHLNNACRISDDAVSSPRAGLETASPPVPGNAFLEDVSSEYGEELLRESVRPAMGRKAHVAGVIGGFIKKNDFDGAELARREFLKMDIPIEPDVVYLKMVQQSLMIHDEEARFEAFSTWLPLLPPWGLSRFIMQISDDLLRHPFDLNLLRQFCLLCAQAGLISDLLKCRILHHVFRYAYPPATLDLLEELEDIARSKGKNEEEVMGFRNLAIRMHYIAGRREFAKNLAEETEIIEPTTRLYMERNSSATSSEPLHTVQLPPASRSRDYRSKNDPPTSSELASKLRLIRQAILVNAPPNLISNVADFIYEYVVLAKRKRAFFALRRKVFQASSSSVRAKWVAAEQLYYSSQHYPLAILRAHLHYCVADHVLASEVLRVFNEWTSEKKGSAPKTADSWLAHNLPPISTYTKVWPSRISCALTWKAIIQLSGVEDLERLYQVLYDHVKAAKKDGKEQEVELEHDDPEDSEEEDAPPLRQSDQSKSLYMVTPPAVFPTAAFFHHFVVAMSTRISPLRGAKVVADIQQLGLKATVDDWGAVAGAYARSGDVRRLAVILKHVDKMENVANAPDSTYSTYRKANLRRRIIVMHSSVIRGLTECGMYRSARKVQERMQQRGYFKRGVDVRTQAILHRLSRYEKGHFDSELNQRREVLLKKRPIRVLEERIQWKDELNEDSRPPWKQNILQDPDRSEWWYHVKEK